MAANSGRPRWTVVASAWLSSCRRPPSSLPLPTLGRELLDAADTEAVRSEYPGNAARALAAGVFGSPFYVFVGELFWGQHRLDMLEEAIVRSATGNLGRGPG